jgi:hypothetical protein
MRKETKTCRGCGQEKSKSEFDEYSDIYGEVKKRGYCKECREMVKSRAEDREKEYKKFMEDDHKCLQCHELKSGKYFSFWYTKNKYEICLTCYSAFAIRKWTAQGIIYHKIESGEIIIPDVCEKCGGLLDIYNLSGVFHRNLDKPLEVSWVCKKCVSEIRPSFEVQVMEGRTI